MGKAIYSSDQQIVVEKRVEAGLTQAQVAEKLKCTQSYVSKIESGQIQISVVLLKRLASLYKREVSYFI